MDFCLVKDLCLKIYLQVLTDIYNPTFLKSNIASSPQNYDFSGLPISGKDTNALQWSRLETLVSFSPPSPISCITFCPPEDSGIPLWVLVCLPKCRAQMKLLCIACAVSTPLCDHENRPDRWSWEMGPQVESPRGSCGRRSWRKVSWAYSMQS